MFSHDCHGVEAKNFGRKTAMVLKENGHDVFALVKWRPAEQISSGLNRLREMEIPVYFWGAPASFSNRLKALLQRLAHKIQGMVSAPSVDYKIIKADLIVSSCPGNEFPIVPIRECVGRGQRYVLIIQSVSEGYWPKIPNWKTGDLLIFRNNCRAGSICSNWTLKALNIGC